MTRLAWLTDIHLNFLGPAALDAFLASLADAAADAFLLGGDTGEADDVAVFLDRIETAVRRPVYAVLGNHDFYRGTVAGVRAKVRQLCAAVPGLHYLPDAGVVPLTATAGLVGHDGWGDGRLGDYFGSDVLLNDFKLIGEFGGLGEPKPERLAKLHALGDEAAAHFRTVLPEALARHRHVVVLTHVPPFREACWHEGRVSDDNWLPFFTCRAVGEVLVDAMRAAPGRTMTVLCGHTHGSGEADILPNLRVRTGGAEYGAPCIQRVIELE